MASASLFNLSARVLIVLGVGCLAGQTTSGQAERKRLSLSRGRVSNQDETLRVPNASILHSATKSLNSQHHPCPNGDPSSL
jgi:hypothetical protein